MRVALLKLAHLVNKSKHAFVLQAHADHLHVQSQQAQSHPVQVQAQVQAQSFQAKAKSLEKAAEAQTLQVCCADRPL